MRLIFPRINGLLSSYMPQILLQIQICSTLNLSTPLPENMPIVLSRTLLCASTRFYYGTIAINTRIMSNYLYFQLPTIVPIFCCKVSPLMPSSCPSSSVSCILPCQQHCCQERYPPNSSTQSPAICPSQCAIHCEDM